MKVLGFSLLMISLCIADDICEEYMNGDCDNDCDPGDPSDDETHILPGAVPICGAGKKCCVELCEEKWNGDCDTAPCDGSRLTVDEVDQCPHAGDACCVKQKKTPCRKLMGGTCKDGGCGAGKKAIGSPFAANKDCLCPSNVEEQCCVTPSSDTCEKVKGGECRPETTCPNHGEKKVSGYGFRLCAGLNDCCVPDVACGRPGVEGICIEEDFCPDGFKTAEEKCKVKAPGFSKWCQDDDEICCVK